LDGEGAFCSKLGLNCSVDRFSYKNTQPNHLGLNILFFIGKLRLNLFFVLPGFCFHYFLSGSGFFQRATYISETPPTEKNIRVFSSLSSRG